MRCKIGNMWTTKNQWPLRILCTVCNGSWNMCKYLPLNQRSSYRTISDCDLVFNKSSPKNQKCGAQNSCWILSQTNVTPTRDDEDAAIYETVDLRHKLRINQLLSKNHKLRAQIGAGLQNSLALLMWPRLCLRMQDNYITPSPAEAGDVGDIRPICTFQQILGDKPLTESENSCLLQHYQDDPKSWWWGEQSTNITPDRRRWRSWPPTET